MTSERDMQLAELALLRDGLGTRPLGTGESAFGPQDSLAAEADALAAELARLASRDAVPPPPSLRERVLAATRPATALEGFAERLGQLLDWSSDRARTLLREPVEPAGAGWIDGPAAGIRLRPLEPGPRHGGSVAGLVWCEPASVFPAHRHRGPEWALVLRGHAWNSSGAHWSVGDLVHQPPGSIHSFRIPEGGLSLLAAVVVRKGFELVPG